MAVGIVDVGMWGSSVGAASGGWSSTGSLSERGGVPDTNFHFSIMNIDSKLDGALNGAHPENQGAPTPERADGETVGEWPPLW